MPLILLPLLVWLLDGAGLVGAAWAYAASMALEVPIGAVGLSLPGVSSVRIDDAAGARAATNHLINLGHERIAMIGGGVSAVEPNPFTTPEDRADGYRQAYRYR